MFNLKILSVKTEERKQILLCISYKEVADLGYIFGIIVFNEIRQILRK